MSDRHHRFKIGQHVEIIPTTLRAAAKGRYAIVRLFPADAGEPRYCIKSVAEKHERIVPEHDLVALQDAALSD